MPPPKSIGFPRMRKEQGEKRVFLPEFIQYLTNLGAKVVIEEGYGSRSGYSFDDYRSGSEAVRMGSTEEAHQQEVVMVLRAPDRREYDLLKPGTILIAMLHYPTRPGRVALLQEKDLKAISLDGIMDGRNIRLVENMKAVAWNGLEAAFDVLEGRWPALRREDGEPLRVLILGAGMVGKHAVEAATKLGNVERYQEHLIAEGPGAIAMTIGRAATRQPNVMQKLMDRMDVLVDATQRRDTSKPVVPNAWIGWLPEHAVVVDLAVDPYLLDADPPVVRGIEGIPQGNLDQYVFSPDDPSWREKIPEDIPCEERRTTVTCYSWPGIHPQACMAHYARQLEPLMEVLFRKGYDDLEMIGGYFERALCRGTLREWLKAGTYEPRPR